MDLVRDECNFNVVELARESDFGDGIELVFLEKNVWIEKLSKSCGWFVYPLSLPKRGSPRGCLFN